MKTSTNMLHWNYVAKVFACILGCSVWKNMHIFEMFSEDIFIMIEKFTLKSSYYIVD